MRDVRIFESVADIDLKPAPGHVVFITEDFVERIDDIVDRLGDAKVCGTVVPYLIADKMIIDKGIAILSLEEGGGFAFTTDMTATGEALRGAIGSRAGLHSLLLFVDGLSPSMDTFISNLNSCVEGLSVLGTGVGYKDLGQRPAVFDADGLHLDRALIVGSDMQLQIGARHGWRTIHGPLVVTRAKDNILHELNNQRAFDVYRDVIDRLEGIELTRERFFEVAKSYPFGVSSCLGAEMIIRDPIVANDDGSLTMVSSVREMDILYVMKGVEEELIDSSTTLAREIFTSSGGSRAILFDCISRALFLGDDFSREVEGVFTGSEDPDIKVFGITSIGEITNIGYEEVKILNKTTLLGVVSDV